MITYTQQTDVRRGFTLVEMLVALTIIGLLTTVSVVQFQSGRQDDALRLATMRMSDALRTSQSAAQSGSIEQYANAQGYGVYVFQTAASKSCVDGSTTINEGIVLFADTDSNKAYTPNTDTVIRCQSLIVDGAPIVLEKIEELKAADDSIITVTTATAFFQRPTSFVLIDAATEMKKLTLTLKNTRNNHTKQVVLDRISGRIDFDY
ncbi:MAG: type II secretion system protein [Patescibacteria group bacterium]